MTWILTFAGGLTLVASLVSATHGSGAEPLSLDLALADAARHAVLADVDPNERMCRRQRSLERWLLDLTRRPADAIRWTGGRCRLQRDGLNDAGGHWCGQATISVAQPRNAEDMPMIEVYFEAPRGMHSGNPYAFRGEMLGADGWDYTRFPADFEATWSARFPARSQADQRSRCQH